eukprot:CAMPEP_0114598842 /NCGR_PEP_ID=MMETSP0125-20121206/21260_1 /TAXON_ID=485358 ORGANISM="Aristerostoma sp., Strain ATCC 50986" /NCGR_SAMPLE_ID=MMETSP0125 /ASSEMBLY_ACC=CAM_ASM_000245 /LENGTH=39 /DNA_ID= /DNA_START= /DNA_END= /DNA_ORIENTATION=
MAEVNEATGLEFEDFEKLLEIAEKRYSNSKGVDYLKKGA